MKARAAGFSIVEVVMALAIFAVVGVSLIGLLSVGINVSHDALVDAEVTMLVENVQARLSLDPKWPGAREAVFYDNSGTEVAEEAAANFRVTFTSIPGQGFSSDYFDVTRVVVERLPHKKSAGIWTLQRVRLSQGKAVAAQ